MRDKLIELISAGQVEFLEIQARDDDPQDWDMRTSSEVIADHLIANGVTIREHGVWKPYYDHFKKEKQIGWICTNCSVVVKGFDTGYCPWCGAVMDDYEDDEPPKEKA